MGPSEHRVLFCDSGNFEDLPGGEKAADEVVRDAFLAAAKHVCSMSRCSIRGHKQLSSEVIAP